MHIISKYRLPSVDRASVWAIYQRFFMSHLWRKFSFCCPRCISHRCFARRLLASRQDAWRESHSM